MATKRSRANFEADGHGAGPSFVVFGTPLPPLDGAARDDGSYVPVWKQEVRDERGRKRLHGAFTGGFSAGYFNTVGSKEGWTPSTFVSSRTNRRKDDAATTAGATASASRRPEDYMDAEDLADQAEAQKLQTADNFAGLGDPGQQQQSRRAGGLADLFKTGGETMGIKLLKRMGWKEGQGIGPRVRRKARLDAAEGRPDDGTDTYLFAPENVPMIAFVKKQDRKGLGHAGEARLAPAAPAGRRVARASSDEDDDENDGPLIRPRLGVRKPPRPARRGGIGMGVLNDTGSDDEDPYEIGPRISYNRVIGGDKSKKKAKAKAPSMANPTLRAPPVFTPRKKVLARSAQSLRKCHDGRLPLDGFVFGTEADSQTPAINPATQYPPPAIPPGWKSSKTPKGGSGSGGAPGAPAYLSTTDAAKLSQLDAKARAELLGEAPLPGKSVFDFLSADARDRLAAASGRANLPPALGEVPAGYVALTPDERRRELEARAPVLDKATALAALTRGASGGGGTAPYADDDAKRARYRAYLETAAGFAKAALPPKRSSSFPGQTQTDDDWLREMREYHSVARIFKPMAGMMASRFAPSSSSSTTTTTATTSTTTTTTAEGGLAPSAPPPPSKPADPQEEAAKLGMYGTMTRSTTDFYPTRLLCKRFNVRPPAHVQPDAAAAKPSPTSASAAAAAAAPSPFDPVHHATTIGTPSASAAMTLDELLKQAQQQQGPPSAQETTTTTVPSIVDPDVNEAIEGKRAQDDVFRAIFGDSDDED